MNYAHHYGLLIKRAQARNRPAGYVERHHIVPKCMGGGNELDNIAVLTPEEHYVAHQLLVKMHPGNAKLAWAASAMCGTARGNGRSNRLYGWLRRRLAKASSEANRGRVVSDEARRKMSLAKIGKKRGPMPPQTKAALTASRTGSRHTPEAKAKMSAACAGAKRKPHSAETKAKIAESNRQTKAGMKFAFFEDDDYRKKQSDNMKRIWAARRGV